MKNLVAYVAMASLLAGCATTQERFYADPSSANDTSLCRALNESSDPTFKRDLANELAARNVTAEDCEGKITTQNVAVAGIAVFGAALAIAAAGGTGGRGYYTPPTTYGVAWDQFYNQYYQLIWRCRDRASGRFVDDWRCSGKLRADTTWPGWTA